MTPSLDTISRDTISRGIPPLPSIGVALLLFLSAFTTTVIGSESESEYLGPNTLITSRDGKTLYVANTDARQVFWIELPTGNITRKVEMPAGPQESIQAQ